MAKEEYKTYVIGNTVYRDTDLFKLYMDIYTGENGIFFSLNIIEKETSCILSICFNKLEDVDNFIKGTIYNSKSLKEIMISYRELFEHGELAIPNPIKVENGEAKVSLLDINQMIAAHFGRHKNYKVGAKFVLDQSFSPAVIRFYEIEHLDYAGIKRDNEILLSRGDLVNVFNRYLGGLGYELEDFEYIGESPNYTGIKLKVKEKELGMKFRQGE